MLSKFEMKTSHPDSVTCHNSFENLSVFHILFDTRKLISVSLLETVLKTEVVCETHMHASVSAPVVCLLVHVRICVGVKPHSGLEVWPHTSKLKCLRNY